MRVVALLATYNEELVIGRCIEHLIAQGLDIYLIDNESTDDTLEIAHEWLESGVIGIETFPRHGMYSWRPLLERKQHLATTIDASWFVHVDADEFRLPPTTHATLAEALMNVDSDGYNAVNFMEHTFVPTIENPDHENPRFVDTMISYYPFLPAFPHRLNAWKKQTSEVDLASAAGHKVSFPGLRMYPRSFPMRHYLFLSLDHARRKYGTRLYDPVEVEAGWHRKRARIRQDSISLQRAADLNVYRGDRHLDSSQPLTEHPSLMHRLPTR